MVAPLFVMSLLWERFDWRASRLLRPRSFSYRLGPLQRTVGGTAIASGVLLVLMGAATLWIGLTRDSMPSPHGWQAHLSSRLQHYGSVLTKALGGVPGWLGVLIVVAAVLLLARRAIRQLLADRDLRAEPGDPAAPPAGGDAVDKKPLEHEYA